MSHRNPLWQRVAFAAFHPPLSPLQALLPLPPSLGQLFIPTPSPCDNTKNPPFYELIHWEARAEPPKISPNPKEENRWRDCIRQC